MAQSRVPPKPPAHLQQEAHIIEAWARTETQNPESIARILGCMSEAYLRTLPTKKGSRKLPKSPAAREWRHKFYRSVAGFLGWCEQRKFPEEILEIVREKLWPDTRVRGGDGQDKACIGPVANCDKDSASKEGPCCRESAHGVNARGYQQHLKQQASVSGTRIEEEEEESIETWDGAQKKRRGCDA